MKAGKLIYKVALPVPLRRLFDYLPPLEGSALLARGTRVIVPFGRQQLVGLVLNHAEGSNLPESQLKNIISVCDTVPLFPLSLCDLIQKTANYYHHPIGEVAFTGLPQSLRQGKTYIPKVSSNAKTPPPPWRASNLKSRSRDCAGGYSRKCIYIPTLFIRRDHRQWQN